MSFIPYIRKDVNIVIETGPWHDDSAHAIATECPQVDDVHTIELSESLWHEATLRGLSEKIRFYWGDSGEILGKVVEKAMFKKLAPAIQVILDAHYSGAGTARADLASPVRAELQALIPYGPYIHSVLIDDANVIDLGGEQAGNPLYTEGGSNWNETVGLLKQIKPNFVIRLERDGRDLGILIAELPETANE